MSLNIPAETGLVIFDCDGTLLDSERVYNECAIRIFSDYGFSYTLDHAYKNWMGKALEDIVGIVAAEQKTELSARDFIDRFIREVPKYQQEFLKPVEGALDAVKILSGRFRICVASNGEKPNIHSSLRHMGYGDLFGMHVFNKDDVARAKPFPDLFLHACEKMGSVPGNALVIEDSLSGVKAGRAAGMYVIGFNGVGHSELQSETALLNAGADIVFSDWKDILSYICK